MSQSHTFVDLDPAAVEAQRGKVRIIDVREPDEYQGELGHIPEAELVPLATVPAQALSWPRDTPVIMVCRSGGRSGRAAGELVRMGFSQVHNMVGGMLRWNQEQRTIAR
jgi:rhodanese-related sulfurtransferase